MVLLDKNILNFLVLTYKFKGSSSIQICFLKQIVISVAQLSSASEDDVLFKNVIYLGYNLKYK